MTLTSKTFRIFVSSTFSDFKEERNALQKNVFPKLKDLCRRSGCRFQAIDLRWGVREEAALDQQTMAICLEEIERCKKTTPRPNFIVLLGDRYGWQPVPAKIPAAEFVKIVEQVRSEDDRDFLLTWYRREDNAVPSIYCLLPRKVDVHEIMTEKGRNEAAEEESRRWEQTQARLLGVLRAAVSRISLAPKDALKYFSSATEHEIFQGALSVPDAKEHVFCFMRKIIGLPKDSRARDFIDLDENGIPDLDAQEKLERLAERLSPLLPDNIHHYETEWSYSHQSPGREHIERFSVDVYERLSAVIREEIRKMEEADALEKEIKEHLNFAIDRSSILIGREDILDCLLDYVKGIQRHPLAVFGEPGSGKSALLARLSDRAIDKFPRLRVFLRFIGVTPDSSDIHSLLHGLSSEISRSYGGHESTVPTEYMKLVEEFPKTLALASHDKPLLIILDALDQLGDVRDARLLNWLPTKLPEWVKIVVSTLPGECLDILRKKLPETNCFNLPPLSCEDGEKILDVWLQGSRRTLQEGQRREVIQKFRQNGLPLYLKFAFEEARLWKSYSPPNRLSPDIPGVIHDLFARISSDARHGRMFVSRSLAYLAASRNGLSEDELLDILSSDPDVFEDFKRRARHEPPERRLPVVVWSRLFFDLEAYFTERSAGGALLLGFYHGQLKEAAVKEFLGPNVKTMIHRRLADYFTRQPLDVESNIEGEAEKLPNLRKVSELPYQQIQGLMWEDLERTLTSLPFIRKKSLSGMVADLEADYIRALDAWPGYERLDAFRGGEIFQVPAWIRECVRAVLDGKEGPYPEKGSGPVWSRLKAMPEVEKLFEGEALYKETEIPGYYFGPDERTAQTLEALRLKKRRRSFESSEKIPSPMDLAATRVQEFADYVSSHRDLLGKFLYDPIPMALDEGGSVAEAARELLEKEIRPHLVSADAEYKLSQQPSRTSRLNGRSHLHRINVVAHGPSAYSGDGRILASAEENVINVWDAVTGRQIWTLRGHTGEVLKIVLTPDGLTAASSSKDHTLRAWELHSGACTRVLDFETNTIVDFGLSVDGAMAVVAAEEGIISVCDLDSGIRLRTFHVSPPAIKRVALTEDGRIVLLTTQEGTELRESANGDLLWRAKGLFAQAISKNGRLLMSAENDPEESRNNRLVVYDVLMSRALKATGLQTDFSFDLTPDFRLAVSAAGGYHFWSGERHWIGADRLYVWDVSRGELLKKLGPAHGVFISHEGRLAASVERGIDIWDTWGEESEYTGLPRADTSGAQIADLLFHPEKEVWIYARSNCIFGVDLPQTYHRDDISSISLTPDGKILNTASLDGTIRVWSLEKKSCLRSLKVGADSVHHASLSPDGRTVVAGNRSGDTGLWDLLSGIRRYNCKSHEGDVHSVKFSPDGRFVLASGKDGSLNIINVRSWESIFKIRDSETGVFDAAISPDGRVVVTGGDDGQIRVWDFRSRHCLRLLKRHSDFVRFVKFTPDGKTVVSSGSDGFIAAWDLASGRLLGTYYTGRTFAPLGDISPDGRFPSGALEPSFLALKNIPQAPPVATLIRVFRFEPFEGKSAPDQEDLQPLFYEGQEMAGRYDDELTAECRWCRKRFAATRTVVETVQKISSKAGLSPDDSPILQLPDSSWEDPGLIGGCPCCGKPLRFNPFVVDEWETGRRRTASDRPVLIYDPYPDRWILRGHSSEILKVGLSLDGRRAVTGGMDKTLRIWDLDTGACLHVIDDFPGEIIAAAISPDGRLAVANHGLDKIRVLDVESANTLWVLEGHKAPIRGISVDSQGRRAVSIENRGGVQIWNLQDGSCLNQFPESGIEITAHTLSWKASVLLTCGFDADCALRLSVQDLQRGVFLSSLPLHSLNIRGVHAMAVSGNGRIAILAGIDHYCENGIFVIDLEKGVCLRKLEAPAKDILVTEDGRTAVDAANFSDEVRFWDVSSGKVLHYVSTNEAGLHCLALTPDKRHFAAGSDSGTLYVWRLPSHDLIWAGEAKGHFASSAVIDPATKIAIVGNADGSVDILHSEKGESIHSIRVHSSAITCLSYDSSRRLLAWGCYDGTLAVRSLADFSGVEAFKAHDGPVTGLAITPCSHRIISGGMDGTVRIWDAFTMKCLRTLDREEGPVNTLAITPDGRRVLTSGRFGKDMGRLEIWDLESAECIHSFTHECEVGVLVLTPDGELAVVADPPARLHVWNIDKKEYVGDFDADSMSYLLQVTPDGQRARAADYSRILVCKTALVFAAYEDSDIDKILALRTDVILARGFAGNSLLFRNKGYAPQAPWVTAVRLYEFVKKDWSESITALCESCGKRFVVTEENVEAIYSVGSRFGLLPEDSAALKLPLEAWDLPDLLSACRICRTPLRFNPFLVDNKYKG